MRAVNKLTAAAVGALTKPGRFHDGAGLYLQVSATGAKSWLLRFMLDGRARHMGLGRLHAVSLKQARQRAEAARQRLAGGADPIEARDADADARRSESAKRVTFKEAATRYIAAHAAGWRNEKHATQWTATLETYAFPVIGELSVAAVDIAHVMQILEPIWAVKTETASRLRGRMESVLDWAKARHYRKGENPARWKGHLDKLLPARARVRAVQHFPAVPYADVPAFMARLAHMDSISARSLEFCILTASRTGETVGARWPEFDTAAKLWAVPGERMKSSRPHRVPLSARALEILAAVPREAENEFVFVGARNGKGLSNMALLECLQGMEGCAGFTVHGFRSAFKTWASERSAFPREVVEAALAHISGDKLEQAYQRSDLYAKRARLIDAWARFCASDAKPAGEVVAIAQELRKH